MKLCPGVEAQCLFRLLFITIATLGLQSSWGSSDSATVEVFGKSRKPVIVGEGGFLAQAFERCLGYKPKVVPQAPYSPAAGEIPIYVGDSDYARAELGKKVEALDPEGYVLKILDDRIFLYAPPSQTDSGTVADWVQFDFMRRFMGVDHFFPGPLGEVYPKRGSLEVPKGEWVEEPAFLHRHWSGYSGKAYGWRLRSSGGGGRYRFHHNLGNILSPSKYQDHPQYFPVIYDEASPDLYQSFYGDLKPGERYVPKRMFGAYWQPCMSNPNVLDIVTQAAVDAMKHSPRNPVFSVGVNDSRGFCHCPECVKEFPSDISPYDRKADGYRTYKFYNKVAQNVSQQVPNARLGFLVYEALASWKPEKLHPALMPYVTASMADCWDEAYRKKLWENYEFWGKHAAQFGVYEWLYGGGFIIPRLYLHDLSAGLKKLHALRCQGFYAEAYPNWGLDGPKLWVLEKLLWNPNQDVDQLIDEWCRGLFGDTAPMMRRYFDFLEKKWREQKPSDENRGGYRLYDLPNTGKQLTEVFPPKACDEAFALLEAAEKTTKDEEVRQRIRFFKSAFALTRFVSHRYAAGERAKKIKGDLGDQANLKNAVAAYADWSEIGSLEQIFQDLEKNAPLAFQAQAKAAAEGGDFRPELKAWDTEFPMKLDIGQAIVEQGLRKLEGSPLTRVGIDAAISDVVNELSDSESVRADLTTFSKGMILTARRKGEESLSDPSFSGRFYRYPSTGETTPAKTNVWIAYDDTRLFLRADCEQATEKLKGLDVGRDNVPLKEGTTILEMKNYQRNFPYLYPNPDRGLPSCDSFGFVVERGGMVFVTAAGSIFDGVVAEGGGFSPSWNGAEAVVGKTDRGWRCSVQGDFSASMVVPFRAGSILKGFNIVRVVSNIKSAWVPGRPTRWAIDPRSYGYLLFE